MYSKPSTRYVTVTTSMSAPVIIEAARSLLVHCILFKSLVGGVNSFVSVLQGDGTTHIFEQYVAVDSLGPSGVSCAPFLADHGLALQSGVTPGAEGLGDIAEVTVFYSDVGV